MPVVMHGRTLLKAWHTAVDTLGMAATELQFDTLDRQTLQVMRAYSARETAAKASRENHDGWLDRFDAVEGLEPQELTQAHGRLIALGMLKFELASRSVGLRYQISQRGKAALDATARHEAAEDADEHAARGVDEVSPEHDDSHGTVDTAA